MNFSLPGIYYIDQQIHTIGPLIQKAENENLQLLMDGIFFHKHHSPNDASFALKLYEQKGISSITKLNGSFNILVLHNKNSQITLISDVLATRPWYFYQKGSAFAVSPVPSFFAQQQLDMELNENALFETILYNYTLSDHTLINELTRNKPFCHLVVSEKNIRFEQNFQIEAPLHKTYNTKEKMADRIYEIIDSNIKAITSHCLLKDLKITLPLTGGFDSRHLLGALLANNKTPANLTHVNIQKIDVKPVRIIAKDLGIPLLEKDIIQMRHKSTAQEWLKRTAGLVNFHQAYLLEQVVDAPEEKMLSFDGYLMDSLLGIRPKFKLNPTLAPSDFILNMDYGSASNHRALFSNYNCLLSKCRKNISARDTVLPGNNFEGGLVQQIICRSINYTGATFSITSDKTLGFAPGACADSLNFVFNCSWQAGMYNKARFLMLEKYFPKMDKYPSLYGILYSQLHNATKNLSIYKTTEKENKIKLKSKGLLSNLAIIIPFLTRGVFEPLKEGEHFWLRRIPALKNLMETLCENSLLAKDKLIEEKALKKIWLAHKKGAFNAWTLLNIFTAEAAYRTLVKKEEQEDLVDLFFD